MKRLPVIIFLFLSIFTQSQTGPRTWQDHLSLNSCNTVARLGSTIYASYYNGLVKFDERELAPQALNKINGLSDVSIRLLRANKQLGKLLVIYENCNIDVIDMNGHLQNYPEFRLKTLSGRKYVNEVTFDGNLAYLACGFGIVVFDMVKMEIRDTYIIGPEGTNLDVYQVAITPTHMYAATETGLLKAGRTSLLRDFHNWLPETQGLPAGPYCGVIYCGNTLLACYSPHKTDISIIQRDTFYTLDNNNKWIKYPPFAGIGQNINRIGTTYGNLFYILDMFGVVIRNISDGALANINYKFQDDPVPVQVQDVFYDVDYTGNVVYWIADKVHGLYRSYVYYMPQEKVTRNGTHAIPVGQIDVFEGRVATAPSFVDQSGAGNYTTEGINIRKINGLWEYIPVYDHNNKNVLDITSVLFDRKDRSVVWAAGWEYGISKFRDGKLDAVYTSSNSAMPELYENHPSCSGLSMDRDGNLWFAQSDQTGLLSVIKRDGELINYRFTVGKFTRKTYVDRNNFVWMLHERDGGITVVKHNNFNIVSTISLGKNPGTGNLESNSVFSIAEDNDGRIWVGTDAGIRVFYSPGSLFNGNDIDAQPIKIVQDGNVELLLEKETVTSIVVDGANNKWVGTNSGGVYCFSPDGQQQLYHFTKANSPLYSDRIVDLNYDATTGDVYLATDMGLQSFRSTVVKGADELTSVYAFPNPVRPGYAGTVLVRGLLNNTIVQITDESGNLVWEAKSEGGQVEWPVRTLSGSRVTNGVYLVYATSSDGEARAVTKVLVIN